MTDTKHSADLPPLPEPNYRKLSKGTLFENCWTADQMQEYARAAIAAAAPKAALTDAELDPLVEKVLRAGGSSLRHYSLQKSKDDMRAAMRECLGASGPNAALVEAALSVVREAISENRGRVHVCDQKNEGIVIGQCAPEIQALYAALAAAGVKP